MINISLDSSELIDLKHLVEDAILDQKTSFNQMRMLEERNGYEKGSLTEYYIRRIDYYAKIKKKLLDALYYNK